MLNKSSAKSSDLINAPHRQDQFTAAMGKLGQILNDSFQEPEKTHLVFHKGRGEFSEALIQKVPPNKGMGLPASLDLFERNILPGVVKTWHPGFFNQMSAGTPLPGVIGEALSAMINGTLATFEASPAGTIIEHMVTSWMAAILGMPEGSAGIFLPGGSLSNMFALVVARETFAKEGVRNVFFCSEGAHYSIANAVKIIGLGPEGLVAVPANERGEMRADQLRIKIRECLAAGHNPIGVVATMGLTVTGGFDPLPEIIQIVKEYPMHLHVDAAFGGGMALTSQGPTLLAGIDKVDTVTWDAHKWMYAPLASSVLLTPNKSLLKKVFASGASYLFHGEVDDPYVDDLGQYTPLCGKRFNALPLWLMLQTYGLDAFKTWSEERLNLTKAFARDISESDDFELLHTPLSPVVCFRHVGEKGMEGDALNQWQDTLRNRIRVKGRVLFNITTWRKVRYFRMIMINPLTTYEFLQEMMADLRNVAAEGG